MIQIIEKIKQNSTPVILFGAGDLGMLAYYALKKRNINIKHFCDSNKKKQGKFFFNIKIISPEELAELDKNIPIFICNSQYVEIVSSLLAKMNFNNIYDLINLLKNTDF